MTVTQLYLSEIYPGYNQSGSLVNIHTIKPTGDWRYFVYPQMYGHFSPGVRKYRLNSRIYNVGWPYESWLFSILTRLQYDYLRSTYCAGQYDGEVTVKTRTDSTSYTVWNAILRIPELTSIQMHFKVFEDFPIELVHMVQLS